MEYILKIIICFFTHIHTFLNGTTSLKKNKRWSVTILSSLRHLAEGGVSTCSGYWLSKVNSCPKDLCTHSFSSFANKFLASKSTTYYYWLSITISNYPIFLSTFINRNCNLLTNSPHSKCNGKTFQFISNSISEYTIWIHPGTLATLSPV